MASSNETKRIQTRTNTILKQSPLTPQPMTTAPPQLATASLNFGVGRSHSIKNILVSLGGTPATQNFCQLLVLCCVYNFVYTVYSFRFSKLHNVPYFIFFFKSNRVLLIRLVFCLRPAAPKF
jgi:hypothetical protein